MVADIISLSDAEFSDELDRRIEELDAAWKAVQQAFGPRLERIAISTREADQLWGVMETKERELDAAWHEASRRRDVRLGRRNP